MLTFRSIARAGLYRAALAICLVLVAIFTWSCIPFRPESYSALPITGKIGEDIIGRNIVATVHGVYAAHVISAAEGTLGVLNRRYHSKGYWLVVDATYGTLVDSSRLSAYLQSGSTRTGLRKNIEDSSTRPVILQPGLKYRSVLVFEVPVVGSVMRLDMLNSFQDERTGGVMDPPLDSQITVTIPSQSVEIRPEINLANSRVQP
ncbi:Uncharacterised protein [Mycobacteroides abscessus subsp. bolletii]|nr:Uncharacterised protein [Mycobacteroides abscessus subsp. bolletii]